MRYLYIFNLKFFSYFIFAKNSKIKYWKTWQPFLINNKYENNSKKTYK